MLVALLFMFIYLVVCYLFVMINGLCVMILSHFKKVVPDSMNFRQSLKFYLNGANMYEDKIWQIMSLLLSPIMFMALILLVIGNLLILPFAKL